MQVDFTKGTAVVVMRASSMIAGGTAKSILTLSSGSCHCRFEHSVQVFALCGCVFTHVNI